jgi:endonuclease YncB( thermonuclease family)
MFIRRKESQGAGRLPAVPVAVFLLALSLAAEVRAQSCLVTGADDAATLRLQCQGVTRTLRLASVRAPRPGTPLEGGEPYGTDGRDLVRGWFVGRQVELAGGTVRLGGEDVRRGLLALGLVEWTAPPAVDGSDRALRAAEREARLGARGLWSYDGWRRHQSSVREPLLIPGIPPLAREEPLAARAARLSRQSAAERRAAFAAAIAQLEAQRPAEPPTPASSGRGRKTDGRRPR